MALHPAFRDCSVITALHIQPDTLGGIAGNMFLAAMFDARPDLLDSTPTAIDAAGLPASCRVSVSEDSDPTFRGKRFPSDPPEIRTSITSISCVPWGSAAVGLRA
jgi:hypothetical protein